MKKVYAILLSLLVTLAGYAQAPQKMSYQAVVRDGNGALIQNHAVGIRIQILQISEFGAAVYVETHSTTTNANGLVTLEIGGGNVVLGAFGSIDWTAGPYFIKTEIDVTGGTVYSISGVSQILSVPYALHSKTAANYIETDPVFVAHPAYGISVTNVSSWNMAYGWGNHSGLYRPINYVPGWNEITSNPFSFTTPVNNQLLKYNNSSSKWENWTPNYLSSYSETDPIWTGVSASYYTKVNQQTSGQAQLHWDNLTNINANILDLADGSLTGSKIGAGIPAANISGLLPILNGGTGGSDAATARTNLGLGALATLNNVGSSQITDGSIAASDIANGAVGSTQILDNSITSTDIAAETIIASDIASGAVSTTEILDGTITTTDISSIDASKVSGISSNYLPRSNGTSLTTGLFSDNGSVTGIGSINANYKFWVPNTSATYSIYAQNSSSNNWSVGIQSEAQNGITRNVGVHGYASGAFAIGVHGSGVNGTTNYGVWGEAGGTGNNFGIYACALNGSTNWAGYFACGDVYFNNQMQAPYLSSSSGTTLVIDASGWIRKLSSDSRLKENIIPLDNSLEKVLQLKGVRFTWKSDNDHIPDIGFIAQDVQKVFPELVVKDNNDGLLSVKYQNIVAILTEAIREQQQQIEGYKTQLQALQEEVRQIKAQLATSGSKLF